MRTIKFRGKDLKTGEWVYGKNIQFQIDGTNRVCIEEHGNQRWLGPETVGQFTGLIDKNGKEIYEGDIVKSRITDGRFRTNPKYENLKVYYDETRGRFSVNWFVPFVGDRFEVIGNIHDNPELLKGGAQ